MDITLFHQCGHNHKWNINSFVNDDCGNGLILSPVHQSMTNVIDLDESLREPSFFDPQFYLPNSQKAKLNSYDFFPEAISGGFATSDFTFYALEAARRCVEFQIERNFNRVIIPARFFTDMIPDYTSRQNVYTVHPFLQAIEDLGYEGDVYLTLPLTRGMIMHDEYRSDLLTWVTGYPRIDGIYLLVDDGRTTKQIQDFDFLKQYLRMAHELRGAGLGLTIGHANTEALLFSLIDGTEITFGAYENTRIFSIDKFVVSDEERRGPRARLYLPGLFNWLQVYQAKQIRDGLPDVWADIYYETEYADEVLAAAAEPHFNFPKLYYHFFVAYQSQVSRLSTLAPNERYAVIRDWLLAARGFYEAISDKPIDLERHGRGDHIQPWLDAANWLYSEYLT